METMNGAAIVSLDPCPPAGSLDYYGLLNGRHWVGLERDHLDQPWFYHAVSAPWPQLAAEDGAAGFAAGSQATVIAGMMEGSEGRDKDVTWALIHLAAILAEEEARKRQSPASG